MGKADWLVLEQNTQLWWGPNRGGYTSSLWRAGLYTEEDAKAIEAFAVRYGRQDKAVPLSDVADLLTEIRDGLARMDAALLGGVP